ncbi:MAG: ATP-binding protein, partial [Rhodopila sp.]
MRWMALRGADLTQSLLAFARRQPLKFEPLNLNEIVSGMQRLLSRVLGETIVIRLHLAEELWPVISDRAQIEAGITSLATNARDAMPRGGCLTITTENRTLRTEDGAQDPSVRPGDYCQLTISDTGSGMTPDVSARIFEPFFTTKDTAEGSGLGLSMVFGFMKQSEGHIDVQSESGTGTRISLFLPRAQTSTAEADDARTEMTAGNNEVVLVVEDNALLRRVVTRQVSGLGYRVLEATDAASALA